MCSDENNAPNAERYLNAQLTVLHENALKCIEEHHNAGSDENGHYNVLAAYTVYKPGIKSSSLTANDIAFQANFGHPHLKFICDHEVLLHITILTGSRVASDSSRTRGGELISLQDNTVVTYRLAFEKRRIVGNDMKVGDYSSAIQLVILDLKKATFHSMEPEIPRGSDAIKTYLFQYLDALYTAGQHVLFSLPEFSQTGIAAPIDYSLMGTDHPFINNIQGVTVEQINQYMHSIWLKSAMSAEGDVSNEDNWRQQSLSEYTSFSEFTESGTSVHFSLDLGTPRVDILCSKEVIIYFSIDEVRFFVNDDPTAVPKYKFENWRIALVVDVSYHSEADDRLVNISFDLTHPRYHHHLSRFDGLDSESGNEFMYELRELIIAFFSGDYLRILESAHYHIIYSHDARRDTAIKNETHEDLDGSWWSLESKDSSGATSRETILRTKMFDFDQVIAISQGSLNAQFAALHASAHSIFSRWEYESRFSAHFKPMNLRLLSNERAIVWVQIRDGKLNTLSSSQSQDGITTYDFTEWRLAFEVPLKMAKGGELEGASSDTYHKTLAYDRHGQSKNRELRYIYLDFLSAEYLHDESTFGDLYDNKDSRSSINKLKAAVWYIREQYLLQLHKDGLNIVTSLPVWSPGEGLPSYALTNLAFHVYSRVEVTRHNWALVTAGTEPIIVIVGVTGRRELSKTRLEFSTDWIVRANKGFSHGTIGISKRVFIEERLLMLLNEVNKSTTLIPMAPDTAKGLKGLRLQTWSEHRDDRPAKWELQPSNGTGCLQYLWEHLEEWRYTLRGNSNMMNGEHSINCVTQNTVELPTTVQDGALCIKVRGKVELTLTHFDTRSTFHATSSVSWSTNVTIRTLGSGIKVDTAGSHDPTFTTAVFPEGHKQLFTNPMDMLRTAFPPKVNLDELVKEIQAFEGVWQYCYPSAHAYSLASPIFNNDGDLLFELRRHGATGPNARNAGPNLPRGRDPMANNRLRLSRFRSQAPPPSGRSVPQKRASSQARYAGAPHSPSPAPATRESSPSPNRQSRNTTTQELTPAPADRRARSPGTQDGMGDMMHLSPLTNVSSLDDHPMQAEYITKVENGRIMSGGRKPGQVHIGGTAPRMSFQ